MPGDLDVLANFSNCLGTLVLKVCLRVFQQCRRDAIAELLKFVVFRDKIRFAVNLNQNAGFCAFTNALSDDAFLGRTAGLFGGSGDAFFA